MAAYGPSAKFLAPAKKRLVIGVLQTRFLTLSSSHFDPFVWSGPCVARGFVDLAALRSCIAAIARRSAWQGCSAIRHAESAAPGAPQFHAPTGKHESG